MSEYTNDIKEAIFDNLAFERWVESKGHDEALTSLLEFKWELTDQIKAHREAGMYSDDPDWIMRITSLVIHVKRRIADVKRDIRLDKGQAYVLDLMDDIREGRDTDD